MNRLLSLLVLASAAAGPTAALAQSSGDSQASEWSIKPRGRVQLDAVNIEAPAGLNGGNFGTDTEVRRAYLGVDGTLPGNLGFRIEADFAGDSVEFTDVYLKYDATDELTLTLGQHKAFFSLEDQTSDLFTSMTERAAFNSAFGFERRIGLSSAYSQDDLLVQFGMFTHNIADFDADEDGLSFDGRVVWSPKVGSGTLHLGASAHVRDFNDADGTARYRARPFVHTTDTRLVDTGSFSATGQHSFGTEVAYVAGPFHATIEAQHSTAARPRLPNPDFWGGYAEIGMLVTPGDTTGYKGGTYDRIRPKRPLGKGGIGAVQLNARYDRLDLNDATVAGGLQQSFGLSAIWVPIASTRFVLNYGHVWVDDAGGEAGIDYEVDAVGIRAQFDF
jgi:phosphate-selective porin OprO/OprP